VPVLLPVPELLPAPTPLLPLLLPRPELEPLAPLVWHVLLTIVTLLTFSWPLLAAEELDPVLLGLELPVLELVLLGLELP